jgi:hypothetical protein
MALAPMYVLDELAIAWKRDTLLILEAEGMVGGRSWSSESR